MVLYCTVQYCAVQPVVQYLQYFLTLYAIVCTKLYCILFCTSTVHVSFFLHKHLTCIATTGQKFDPTCNRCLYSKRYKNSSFVQNLIRDTPAIVCYKKKIPYLALVGPTLSTSNDELAFNCSSPIKPDSIPNAA